MVTLHTTNHCRSRNTIHREMVLVHFHVNVYEEEENGLLISYEEARLVRLLKIIIGLNDDGIYDIVRHSFCFNTW